MGERSEGSDGCEGVVMIEGRLELNLPGSRSLSRTVDSSLSLEEKRHRLALGKIGGFFVAGCVGDGSARYGRVSAFSTTFVTSRGS